MPLCSQQKGSTLAPPSKGLGQVQGPVGGTACWKEALVRHGAAGRAGRPPPKSSSCCTHVRKAAGGTGRARPLPGSLYHRSKETKAPGPIASKDLPVPGHYCFFVPSGVALGGLRPLSQATGHRRPSALSTGAIRKQPPSRSSSKGSRRVFGLKSKPAPQLHALPSPGLVLIKNWTHSILPTAHPGAGGGQSSSTGLGTKGKLVKAVGAAGGRQGLKEEIGNWEGIRMGTQTKKAK